MTDRPSDIKLPDGWTWERVEAARAHWGISTDMVPTVSCHGVVAWETVNAARMARFANYHQQHDFHVWARFWHLEGFTRSEQEG